ncbi:DUF2306 domain-containing protein [Brevundimonas sp.]|uniref:DUF2306 domain-containing protein n=1 Tax=Brevundimonas sp. TaxID=1871086 RepID=UPI003F6F1231
MRSALIWAGRLVGGGLLLATVAMSAVYFTGPEAYDGFFGERDPDRSRLGATLLHAGAASAALLIGALQLVLVGRIRPWLHRLLGQAYVVGVLLSVTGAALILPFALGGAVGIAGFLLLAVFWLVSTTLGLLAAMSRDREEHRAWMMRSYALTLAGVSLRLQLVLLTGVGGLSFDAVYGVTAWSSWIPNLIVCEILIAALRRPGAEVISGAEPPPVPHAPTTEIGRPG